MDSTTRGAVSPRAGSPARTTGSVAPGWALYRGSYASRFTHSSCVARRQRALVVSESRRRDASEGGRRGRDASRRDAPCRRRWRRRATRGSRARVRTCSAPARRDLDAGRGHGVGGSARGERPTSRVHVVETLSELYRARARARCRRSLAVTAFLREWLIFLLHQSPAAAPSDNFHAALSNLEKPARRIASRSRSTNHLRSACAMNAPDVW